MAERQRENAVCLWAMDFSETSQVVHFLARQTGKVHLLAKGARRAKSRTGGAIDLFSEGDLVFITPRGEAMGTLVEFAEQSNHSALRRRLPALNAGLYILEISSLLLAEGDPHPEVFDLLSATLRRLDHPDSPVEHVLAWYQWRLLRFVGLLGDMEVCVGCGEAVGTVDAYFSSRDGGLLCRSCEGAHADKRRVSGPTLAALAAMRSTERGRRVNLSEPQAAALNELLGYHVAYQLGKVPRMFRHLRHAQRAG